MMTEVLFIPLTKNEVTETVQYVHVKATLMKVQAETGLSEGLSCCSCLGSISSFVHKLKHVTYNF